MAEASPPPNLQLTAQTAVPPLKPVSYSCLTVLKQYLRLIQVMLTEYRTTWFYHVFFGMVLPLGLIFFFKVSESEISTKRAIFLLGGNMATSIAYGPTTMLIGKIGWGKQNKEFHYWAALPIPKLTLILAIVSVYLLFAIPGLVTSYVIGCWLFTLPLSKGLALLLFVPLGALSLTGFGAILGVYAKDGETSNIYGNVLIGLVTFLSPTIIPLEAMPFPLRIVAMFIPTTYVADSFRSALEGNLGINLIYDGLILVGFSVAFLVLVYRKLDWRAM